MKSIANIVSVDPHDPEPEAILQAAKAVAAGGVVIFPTRGLYGLAVDAFNPDAVRRIFQIKGRPPNKPLLVLISDPADVQRLTAATSPAARHLMRCLWPGGVTFVMPAREQLAAELTGGKKKIGVRQTAHPVAAALVQAVGSPLTGTSANISGAGGCARVSEIDSALIESVDLVLDCGTLAGGPGSTVVDVSDAAPVILRHGAVEGRKILRCFERFAEQDIDNQP
ncbi:MAG: L-threonylcarbamoyladenylate synthase [Desulfobacteraceae bacterium]